MCRDLRMLRPIAAAALVVIASSLAHAAPPARKAKKTVPKPTISTPAPARADAAPGATPAPAAPPPPAPRTTADGVQELKRVLSEAPGAAPAHVTATPATPAPIIAAPAAPAAGAPPAGDAGASHTSKVVVYDLVSVDMDPAHITMVTGSLLAEIRKLRGVSAIGMDEVRAMLSSAERKQIENCADDSCLAMVVGALGAEGVVLGSVGKVGASTVFGLKRMDMRTAEVLATFNRRMQGGGGEELLESIGPAVETLFPGVEVRAGLTRGVPAEQVARWNPPPIKPWVTLTTGGVGVATAIGALVFFVRERLAVSSYSDMMSKSTSGGVDANRLVALQNEADSSYRTTVVLAPTAAVVLAATGVLYFLTDWQSLRQPAPAAIAVGPSSVGLTVQF